LSMYGLSRKLDMGFDDVLARTRDALQSQGFGVLTEIDVKATLKKKLDTEFRKYIILGACNPPLAHRTLSAELEIGLLLPCNVIVYENDDGGTTVSAVDPFTMVTVVNNRDLNAIAEEADERLRKAIEAI